MDDIGEAIWFEFGLALTDPYMVDLWTFLIINWVINLDTNPT